MFFEYDKAIIGADQRTALNDNVNWLKANGRVKIVIEGHCDERGTAEYNLGLGDRRTKALRDYLVASGIAADRIGTISYGKERPFVIGHDENAWKMNRRGHFAVQGQIDRTRRFVNAPIRHGGRGGCTGSFARSG